MRAKAVVVWGMARAASETRRTNPIGPPRGPVPEENVRNEAKLGRNGVYGQTSSCRWWPGRE
jgi:hypothetical protein